MKGTLTKIVLGLATLVSAGSVPVIPKDMHLEYAYQYEAGSDRSDIQVEVSTSTGESVLVNKGMLADADFVDEDANGVISVGVFSDKKGNLVYIKIPDAQYAQMGEYEGQVHNAKKDEYLSVFEAITPKVDAAIAIDNTAEGYANSTSLTITGFVLTGTDTAIVVSLWTFPSGDSVTGITWNGSENLQKLGTKSADAGGYNNIWGKATTTTGTHNLVVSMASSQVFLTMASYTGVDQTTPFPDAPVQNSSTCTTCSLSATSVSVDQSWIVLNGRSPSRVPTAGSGTFLRKTNGTSGDAGWLIDTDGPRSTGANTMDFTVGAGTTYYIIRNIAPAGDAPPAAESTTTPFLILQGDVTIEGDVIIN